MTDKETPIGASSCQKDDQGRRIRGRKPTIRSETLTDQWGAGARENWRNHGLVVVGKKTYPLIWGEHPHSRRDNQHYVEMHGEPVGFDGHRVLVDVRVTMNNYLKESGLSGDEVRKGGSCTILANGVEVYEFFSRDTQHALIRAHGLIDQLNEHSSGWMLQAERDKLVGRKVFYRERPAVIERLIVDQGCVMIAPDGEPFPPPIYAQQDGRAHDMGEDESVKTDVLDANIWWFRE